MGDLLRHKGHEETLRRLATLLLLLDFGQFDLRIEDSLISLLLQLLNFPSQRLPLRLRFLFLLHQLIQVLVLLVYLVEILVPETQLLNLLGNLLLDRIVIDL